MAVFILQSVGWQNYQWPRGILVVEEMQQKQLIKNN